MTRFIVVADSHIRFPDDDVETYPSNAHMVARNKYVVELCNQIEASFVVHLGDVVHPLPVESGHEPAVELAGQVYEQLTHPIHFVPGNHDVGDKPNAHVAVPPVADEYYGVFERQWGAPFKSFDVDDSHFVIIDTPVLNSGMEREIRQREWLEADLASAAAGGRRIFVFTHYPPFVREPQEREHYDNLGEPGRSWLLGLIKQHRVEAVFSGHVHNFIYNHLDGTDFYVVPSTGFVRPDYSELSAVVPESENGRDDPAKLGFFVVDIAGAGHRIRPIRTNGAWGSAPLVIPLRTSLRPDWQSPIGVTLRHGWMTDIEFPTAGLDEFARKTVRNDATLPALWEARINQLRIPLADAGTPERVERLRALAGRGNRFTVYSVGVPSEAEQVTVESLGPALNRWELIVPPQSFEPVAEFLAGLDPVAAPNIALGPIVPVGDPSSAVHHFVSTGFASADDPLIDQWLRHDPDHRVGELVFRVASDQEIRPAFEQAHRTATRVSRGAVVVIELPRAGESTPFDDDPAVSLRVADAVIAARLNPVVAVFLDGFMDHDRSYYPRHGLIDRHHNPRSALYELVEY
jgi:predicted phosphodiesterase